MIFCTKKDNFLKGGIKYKYPWLKTCSWKDWIMMHRNLDKNKLCVHEIDDDNCRGILTFHLLFVLVWPWLAVLNRVLWGTFMYKSTEKSKSFVKMVLPFNLATSNVEFCIFGLNNNEKQLSVLNMQFSVLLNSLFVLWRELSNYIIYFWFTFTYSTCLFNLFI